MSQRILIVGVGPIGGIIGGRLARAGSDITFVDVDKEHVEAIRDKGLQIDVPDGPFNVKIQVVYPNEIQGKFDIAGIAVRSNYTPDALTTVMPHLAGNGLLMSMQNGINPPCCRNKSAPTAPSAWRSAWAAARLAPAISTPATRGHLYVGHLHGKTTPQLESLNQLLNTVMESEISDNILGVLWSKLTYTCLGYYGSLADASLTDTCASAADRQTLANFFAEVVAVGMPLGARWIHTGGILSRRISIRSNSARQTVGRSQRISPRPGKHDDRKGPLRQIQKKIKTEVDFTLAYVDSTRQTAQHRHAAVPKSARYHP